MPKELSAEKKKAKEEKRARRRRRDDRYKKEHMDQPQMRQRFGREPRMAFGRKKFGPGGWQTEHTGPDPTGDSRADMRGTQDGVTEGDMDGVTVGDMEGIPPGMLHPEMEGYPDLPTDEDREERYHEIPPGMRPGDPGGPPLEADMFNQIPRGMYQGDMDDDQFDPDQHPLVPDGHPINPDDGHPLDPDGHPIDPDDGHPLDPDGHPIDADEYYAGIPRGMRPGDDPQMTPERPGDDPQMTPERPGDDPQMTPEMKRRMRDQWEYQPMGEEDPEHPFDPDQSRRDARRLARPGKWKYRYNKDSMKYQPYMEPGPVHRRRVYRMIDSCVQFMCCVIVKLSLVFV